MVSDATRRERGEPLASSLASARDDGQNGKRGIKVSRKGRQERKGGELLVETLCGLCVLGARLIPLPPFPWLPDSLCLFLSS